MLIRRFESEAGGTTSAHAWQNATLPPQDAIAQHREAGSFGARSDGHCWRRPTVLPECRLPPDPILSNGTELAFVADVEANTMCEFPKDVSASSGIETVRLWERALVALRKDPDSVALLSEAVQQLRR